MIDKIWNFRHKSLKENDINEISEKCRIPKIITTILLNRSVKAEDIPSFIKKSLGDVIDPMLMLDMDKAVERVNRAVDNKEKIVVYGDYDVDGITATAILYEFLQSLGADVEYYIPDRKGEGYGINIMAVNKLAKEGVNLMITVDCGITALGEVSLAKMLKMDVIVTDHHTCKDRLPTDAVAILNPKRPDCDYPCDALAGVGVAFKLALAVAVSRNLKSKDIFEKYIDIAALGTVADVVPLISENRVIVDRGLKALQNPQRVGLKAIMEVAGVLDKEVNTATVGFAIAPRLNAAGRLGRATTAVELLLSTDENKARQIALTLDSENKERQETEKDIFDQAMDMIAKDVNFEKKKVIVLSKEGWHQGVIGIVASRLCDMYYKPCILISTDEGRGKGSGRSIKGFNLFEALSACQKHLTEFGGHAVAAGLNLNSDDIEDFSKAINKYADENLTDKDMIPTVEIDCPISERNVTLETARLISKLEPFGMGNEKPVFAMSMATVQLAQAVGVDGKHLRLKIEKNGARINGIGFGMGEYADILETGDIIHIAFGIDINSYQGIESVQLIIKDIKKKQN